MFYVISLLIINPCISSLFTNLRCTKYKKTNYLWVKCWHSTTNYCLFGFVFVGFAFMIGILYSRFFLFSCVFLWIELGWCCVAKCLVMMKRKNLWFIQFKFEHRNEYDWFFVMSVVLIDWDFAIFICVCFSVRRFAKKHCCCFFLTF